MATKGPWRLAGGMVDGYAIIGSDNSVICETGRISNANNRHIVSCVNSHDELLEALEEIDAEAEINEGDELTAINALVYIRQVARAAIAKARGE